MRRILILAKDRSQEELVSKIHKELLKLSDNKIRNSVKKINKTSE